MEFERAGDYSSQTVAREDAKNKVCAGHVEGRRKLMQGISCLSCFVLTDSDQLTKI